MEIRLETWVTNNDVLLRNGGMSLHHRISEPFWNFFRWSRRRLIRWVGKMLHRFLSFATIVREYPLCVFYLCDHYEGAPTLRPKMEEDREQMGCWSPPLQIEGPNSLQESREQGNWEVHHVGKHEPGVSAPSS